MVTPPISDIVQDPQWQRVRKTLMGKWKDNPEWCCHQLRKYLGNIKITSYDKLRIVMNYLTSTGFRTGQIKHECINKLRNEISLEMKRRKTI